MDMKSNFDRARRLTESWPAWKRNYQLTKSPRDEHQTQAEAKAPGKQVKKTAA